MASVTTNLSNFSAFLKDVFPPKKVELIAASRNNPTLQWIPKSENFGGASITIPVQHGNPAGRSADFTQALNNANKTQEVKFVISDTAHDYNFVNIDAETIMRSNRGDWSYASAKAKQVKGKLQELSKSASIALFRSGSGSVATVSAIGNASGTNDLITLADKSQVHYFSVGQRLNFNNTDNATSLYTTDGSTTAVAVVESIDHAAGTIEVDVNTDFSGGGGDTLASGNYIFNAGDADAKISGFEAWIPLTAPGLSDSFFGVNRSVNVAALSGHRVDNSGRSILENGLELHTLIGEFGGSPDVWVMHPRAGMRLAADVGVKVERRDGGHTKTGFSGYTLVGHMSSDIDVMFDYACPRDRAFMLTRDSWKLYHVGGLPHIVEDDGLMVRVSNTFDGIECRSRYYAELACEEPGLNGVMSVRID